MDIMNGTPETLKDLVDYQTGSVVSRELIKRPSGTLTVFAFDKDQGLSEHTAPFDAFVLVLDGTATVNIDGTSNEVGPGEAINMPAGKPHSLNAQERFKMLLVLIKE